MTLESHDVIAEFSKDSLDLKILNLGNKNYRLRISNLRYPIYNTTETQVVLKYNKIIVKMHKREPLMWKELRQDPTEHYQNSCLEEGCIRMLEVLKLQGDPTLQNQIKKAEEKAKNFKY